MGFHGFRDSVPCEAILLWNQDTQSGVDCLQTPSQPRKLKSGRWTHLCEDCQAWTHRAGLLAPYRPKKVWRVTAGAPRGGGGASAGPSPPLLLHAGAHFLSTRNRGVHDRCTTATTSNY
jgi:hypothetical protein